MISVPKMKFLVASMKSVVASWFSSRYDLIRNRNLKENKKTHITHSGIDPDGVKGFTTWGGRRCER